MPVDRNPIGCVRGADGGGDDARVPLPSIVPYRRRDSRSRAPSNPRRRRRRRVDHQGPLRRPGRIRRAARRNDRGRTARRRRRLARVRLRLRDRRKSRRHRPDARVARPPRRERRRNGGRRSVPDRARRGDVVGVDEAGGLRRRRNAAPRADRRSKYLRERALHRAAPPSDPPPPRRPDVARGAARRTCARFRDVGRDRRRDRRCARLRANRGGRDPRRGRGVGRRRGGLDRVRPWNDCRGRCRNDVRRRGCEEPRRNVRIRSTDARRNRRRDGSLHEHRFRSKASPRPAAVRRPTACGPAAAQPARGRGGRWRDDRVRPVLRSATQAQPRR